MFHRPHLLHDVISPVALEEIEVKDVRSCDLDKSAGWRHHVESPILVVLSANISCLVHMDCVPFALQRWLLLEGVKIGQNRPAEDRVPIVEANGPVEVGRHLHQAGVSWTKRHFMICVDDVDHHQRSDDEQG